MELVKITLKNKTFDETKAVISKKYKENNVLFDSFLEDMLKGSNFYSFLMDNEEVAWFGITETSTLTFFHAKNEYAAHKQELFARAKRFECVKFAMAPTGDEELVSLCMDSYTKVENQAYFFRYGAGKSRLSFAPIKLLELDFETEMDLIGLSKGFLDDDVAKAQKGNKSITTYKVLLGDTLVGFGHVEHSSIDQIASMGMYVLENYRQHGYAKSILFYLKEQAENDGLTPVSGCWYYNHNSKKSIEAAGGYSDTRLLKFHF